MEVDKKIKDIYEYDYIVAEGELYPLQKWYNQLLDKRIDEIDVSDVLRMIRQNEFIDIAIIKAIDYLKDNPFAGDMYEGELLEKLSEIDTSCLIAYFDEVKSILSRALDESKRHEWLCEEEKEEYEAVINSFSRKILSSKN